MESDRGNNGRNPDGTWAFGNVSWKTLPVEYKLVRDSIKQVIYKAAAGLAMTPDQALVYYNRPEASVLEQLFADALKNKRWDILERFFDRIMGKPSLAVTLTGDTKTLLDDLNAEQKRNAVEAASRTIE